MHRLPSCDRQQVLKALEHKGLNPGSVTMYTVATEGSTCHLLESRLLAPVLPHLLRDLLPAGPSVAALHPLPSQSQPSLTGSHDGRLESETQALTAEQGSSGAGWELQREPQGRGSELRTAPEATNSGSWMGQIPHQDPAWPTLSLTHSVSQFHLNVWSRGIFQNMNQTVPWPCLKPHGTWEKIHAPHLGHLSFLTCVSVAPASASSHVLFHPPGEPCPTCARGQPFSWAGFN